MRVLATHDIDFMVLVTMYADRSELHTRIARIETQ